MGIVVSAKLIGMATKLKPISSVIYIKIEMEKLHILQVYGPLERTEENKLELFGRNYKDVWKAKAWGEAKAMNRDRKEWNIS